MLDHQSRRLCLRIDAEIMSNQRNSSMKSMKFHDPRGGVPRRHDPGNSELCCLPEHQLTVSSLAMEHGEDGEWEVIGP